MNSSSRFYDTTVKHNVFSLKLRLATSRIESKIVPEPRPNGQFQIQRNA